MAINNRSLSSSEQNRVIPTNYGLSVTGAVLNVAAIPYPCTLNAVKTSLKGLSGALTGALKVDRFIVGTGLTTIAGSATTLTFTAIGTSGMQNMVLAASGSSFLSLQANDVVTITLAGTNAAADALSVALVVQAIQDIKQSFTVTG